MGAVEQLGYLGFGVTNLEAWRTFATDVLGLWLVERPDGEGFRLRNDSHAWRFEVVPADRDDLTLVGWQVTGANALEEMARRLSDSGVEIETGSEAEARARGVQGLVRFRDPANIPSEIYYGPARAQQPFASRLVRSGFVADEQGLGHCVLRTKDREASVRFYTELLGFQLSDYIKCEYFGHDVDLAFFHVNRRHHTIALGGPLEHRIHHFMLQVGSIDDVGLAYDRCIRSGVRIAQTLGRHPNDRMFSFYAHTPSGFQFEYGWGAREIDDAEWQPTTYDCISEWGHHPPAMLAPRRAKKRDDR